MRWGEALDTRRGRPRRLIYIRLGAAPEINSREETLECVLCRSEARRSPQTDIEPGEKPQTVRWTTRRTQG